MIERVMIISGCGGGSFQYRVQNKIDQLQLLGVKCAVFDKIPDRLGMHRDADILLLHRQPWTEEIDRLIALAHKKNVPVIFDTDDLIFAPDHLKHFHALETMPTVELNYWTQVAELSQKTIDMCDGVIVSTEALVSYVDKPAYVVRNSRPIGFKVDHDNHKGLIIGYMCGSNTHDNDFKVCAKAMKKILRRYPEVQLLIVGPLTIPEILQDSPQVFRKSMVNWNSYSDTVADMDICIAPLEIDNLFCRCKSEIKYIESATYAIPTIATPIPAYEYAIVDGENGMLAEKDQWEECLDIMISNRFYRGYMGQMAQNDDRYEPIVNAKQLVGVLESFK